MIIEEEDYLAHYGILRRSGRYPWGSGGPEHNTGNRGFLDYVAELEAKGMTPVEIAKGMDTTTTQLRIAKSNAKAEEKQADISRARSLKEAGNSTSAIGRIMGRNESSIRSLLAEGAGDKAQILDSTANMLKDQVAKKKYIEVGSGVEHQLGISRNKLDTAIGRLKEEGYELRYIKEPQLGTAHETTMKVLTAPGVPYSEVSKNRDQISVPFDIYSNDGGRSFLGIVPPLSISSSRVAVNYSKKNAKGEEIGGGAADGVIYVRPGIDDISLGGNRYAQVRIAIDGTHYLKGMAMYKDDLPPGVDLMFNTNKSDTGNKLDAMKPMKTDEHGKIDPDNPFGSALKRQITVKDEHGNNHATSAMNLVNEEGSWDDWSKSLSSQTLSKQSPKLIKQQLDVTLERRQKEFDEIMGLTNAAVRKHLLERFAEETDSAAVKLKAATIPRSSWYAILPFNSIKETEIYAPKFRDGEQVALIRFPHAGTFEIPVLTVNNRHQAAKRTIGQAPDAVGIHHKVAQHLSGADFDGDAVLVIPNNSKQIKTTPALAGLKDFDPQHEYPPYDGMKTMDGGRYNASTRKVEYEPGKPPSGHTKGVEMGDISNLITDMTLLGAPPVELARAVRHSMVVIDAEKHNLNWKLSKQVNGIAALKEKYQGKKNAGASTLISQARAQKRIPHRRERKASEGGFIDKATGKKVYVETGKTHTNKKGQTVATEMTVKRLADTDNAHTLVSKARTEREVLYADHANQMKAIANAARKEAVNTKNIPQSTSAKIAYADEVKSLKGKLAIAVSNRPLERQAQILANAQYRARTKSNPAMENSEKKRIKSQALAEARTRTGADKHKIKFTQSEWDAIQARAISHSQLLEMLKNADLEDVKKLATPKPKLLMTPNKTALANTLLASGYTQAEVADRLGVSLTTLKVSLSEGS